MTSIIKVNEIQDAGGNTILSSNGTGTFTSNLPSANNTPAFRVRLSADQSISTGTDTKINFNTKDYDTDNAISNGTFTVPSGKNGIYQISSAFHARSASNNVTVAFIYIYKNGSEFAYQYFNITSGATIRDHFICINTALELNAGDTIEIYARVDGTSPVVEVGNNGAYFNMYKIIT